MERALSLSARDRSLLKLLSWTPATTTLLLKASVTFDGRGFDSERRLRERMQALATAGFVRSWSTAHAGGGLENYYKLSQAGFELLFGPDATPPPRAFFAAISPSLFEHTHTLAEVIVEIVRACHSGRITIERFFRENELTFTAGNDQVQPDCFIRFACAGKTFNVAFEIDQSQESLDSYAVNSVRQKLQTYDTYQATLLSQWLAAGKTWSERPRFRVAFLTRSIERAYHSLSLAAQITSNVRRRFVYAATQEHFLGDPNSIRSPIFLDHLGEWHSIVDLHPTAKYRKTPVRFPRPLDGSVVPW